MNKPSIAVVIPTIRKDKEYRVFLDAWDELFERHNVRLITVFDGDHPRVVDRNMSDGSMGKDLSLGYVMGDYADCITNRSGSVRNLGFAYVAKHLPDIDVIITLDDDVVPIGDTIQDHLNALEQRVPISWMPTMTEYTRGFPYGIREEAEVVLSHGLWEKNLDWDAPTQLVLGNDRVAFPYMGAIPKGIYFPMCIMNVAFKRKLLPYMFQAPDLLGVGRMDDIFCGILAKREIDKNGWAVVNGLSMVSHTRASNVYKNLQKEAIGIELNETFWMGNESHPYFDQYRAKYDHWKLFIESCNE